MSWGGWGSAYVAIWNKMRTGEERRGEGRKEKTVGWGGVGGVVVS